MADNYYLNENYDQSLNVLKLFDTKDDLYYWFKIKQEAKMITEKKNKEEALKYIEKNLPKYLVWVSLD